MMYHFTRRRLALFVACLGALWVLTYAAGVITGIGLVMPTREEIAMLKASKPASASAAVSLPHPTLALPAVPKAAALPEPQAPAVPPAGPEHSASAPSPPEPAAAANEAPAADAAEKAAQIRPSPVKSNDGFSLQLGSFHDANNAKQLQNELKDRGYTTSIFSALDSDQREWHVVRIDGFKTLDAASKAAADFTGKERITALVRRSNGL